MKLLRIGYIFSSSNEKKVTKTLKDDYLDLESFSDHADISQGS